MPWKDYFLIYVAIAAYLVFISIWVIESRLKKKTLMLPLLSAFILGYAICHVSETRFENYAQWNKSQKAKVGEELYGFAENCHEIVMRNVWGIKNP